MNGKTIVFEGGEGSGKTSMLNLIKEFLENRNCEVMLTREPGGVEIAEQIRTVILDVKNISMDSKTEALLYAASRNEHLNQKIKPALAQGKYVLCDRFIDSSLVYQGYARGIGIEEVYNLNKFVIEDFMPDLTIYLDVAPEEGLRRISSNKEREINRLDKESLEFHNKVREGYLEVLKKYPDRIKKVDANRSMLVVFEEVKRILESYIFKR